MEKKINTLQGIEQGRAKFAYDCALEAKDIPKKDEYKSYVKKIPMMIKTNGLGATFAFIKSKQSKDESKSGYAYKLIYDQTTNWLDKDPKKLISLNVKEDFVDKIISLNSPKYRAITNEILAFFIWLRRFADGLIEDKPKHEKEISHEV